MTFDHTQIDAPRATRPQPRAADAQRAPLLLGRTASPASVLGLQRLAGNGAVQRSLGDYGLEPWGGGSGGSEAAGGQQQQTSSGLFPFGGGGSAVQGDGSGPTTISGSTVDVNTAAVNLNAPVVSATGVLRAQTIIADSVVASNYTPGAGNVM